MSSRTEIPSQLSGTQMEHPRWMDIVRHRFRVVDLQKYALTMSLASDTSEDVTRPRKDVNKRASVSATT